MEDPTVPVGADAPADDAPADDEPRATEPANQPKQRKQRDPNSELTPAENGADTRAIFRGKCAR